MWNHSHSQAWEWQRFVRQDWWVSRYTIRLHGWYGVVITPRIVFKSWQHQRREPDRVESLLLLCLGPLVRLSLELVQGDAALWLQHQRLVPTESMSLSYPWVLEQQPSHKGNDVRFSNTLIKGCASHGPRAENDPGAEVLRPAERSRFLKGIANLPWVVSALSNTQSLTHATVGCGPIWLCAFGPAVLYGCTLMPWNITAAWLS